MVHYKADSRWEDALVLIGLLLNKNQVQLMEEAASFAA